MSSRSVMMFGVVGGAMPKFGVGTTPVKPKLGGSTVCCCSMNPNGFRKLILASVPKFESYAGYVKELFKELSLDVGKYVVVLAMVKSGLKMEALQALLVTVAALSYVGAKLKTSGIHILKPLILAYLIELVKEMSFDVIKSILQKTVSFPKVEFPGKLEDEKPENMGV